MPGVQSDIAAANRWMASRRRHWGTGWDSIPQDAGYRPRCEASPAVIQGHGPQDHTLLMPIYNVTVKAPAINEEIVVNADNAAQASARAVGSALARQREAVEVTVTEQQTPNE